MVVPPKRPKMIIFSRKPTVVGYHHFRKPPYLIGDTLLGRPIISNILFVKFRGCNRVMISHIVLFFWIWTGWRRIWNTPCNTEMFVWGTPLKILAWNIIMEVWKIIFLLIGWFVGCMLIYPSYFRDNSQTHTIPNWIDYSCKVYSESFSAVGPDSPKTEVWLIISYEWGFPKLVVPNKPMGFPTKNNHFGLFWGYHHLRKHPNRVELPRTQDASHHQEGSSIPTVQPSFVTIASWVGGTG